jgi:hypothetical protein
MLRAEQGDQRDAGRVRKHVNCGPSLKIQSGVISDQANMLPAERRKFLGFQHIKAGLHPARVSPALRGGRVFLRCGATNSAQQ